MPCVPRCPPRAARAPRRASRSAAGRRRPSRDATERRPAVDPELLTLFIEEAGEEIATIGRLYPLWAENPADRESLTRVRRAFHTLKGSGRVVGARRIGDFAWSVENLLNRVIDGTLERSSGMLGTLAEAIAVLPALVDELGGQAGEVAGLAELAQRIEAHTAGQSAPAAAPGARPASPEPTLVLQKLEPAVETRRMAVLAEPPPFAPPEPGPPVDEAWLGRPAAYAEGGDSSLQEIYQKEVQSHLEVIRAYLRHAWLAVGTHTVTEDLYRACHTLRGASRTAEIRHSVRLAEPLHKWLRRMFDHDAPFDEAGLAVLADSVVGFEDVLAGRARGHRPLHQPRPAGKTHRGAGRRARAAPRRGAAADDGDPRRRRGAAAAAARERPPPAAPPPLSLDSLLPGRGTGVLSERDVHGVLPKLPVTTGIEGRPPYLSPGGTVAAARRRGRRVLRPRRGLRP